MKHVLSTIVAVALLWLLVIAAFAVTMGGQR